MMQLNICEEEGGRAGLRPSGEAPSQLHDLGRYLPATRRPALYFSSCMFGYVCPPSSFSKERRPSTKVKEQQHQRPMSSDLDRSISQDFVVFLLYREGTSPFPSSDNTGKGASALVKG